MRVTRARTGALCTPNTLSDAAPNGRQRPTARPRAELPLHLVVDQDDASEHPHVADAVPHRGGVAQNLCKSRSPPPAGSRARQSSGCLTGRVDAVEAPVGDLGEELQLICRHAHVVSLSAPDRALAASGSGRTAQRLHAATRAGRRGETPLMSNARVQKRKRVRLLTSRLPMTIIMYSMPAMPHDWMNASP